MGYAKIAWHVNKMVFQKTIAGCDDVDVIIGPEDAIKPAIMNWNDDQTVDLKVKVLNVDQKEVASKTYKDVELTGGRSVKELEAFRPDGLEEGYYFVVYEIE